MNSENNNIEPAENSPVPVESQEGIYFLALILKHKVFVSIIVLTATVASVVFALMLDNEYVSTVNVVPPKTSSSLMESAVGNIASKLKDIGLTKFGGSSGAGYDLLVILNSRTIMDSMITRFNLPQKYEIPDTMMSDVRKEYEEHIEISYEKTGNYLISFWDKNPDSAKAMANYFVNLVNQKADELHKTEASANRLYLESRLTALDSVLNDLSGKLSTFSNQTLFFSPDEQVKVISSAFAELKASQIQSEILYEMFKKTYGENYPVTKIQKQKAEELKSSVQSAQNKPGFAGDFSLREAAGLGIEYYKLYTEYETFSLVKAYLLPMLEKAKLDEYSTINNLFVVDEAISADKKDRPRRSLIVLGAFFGSFAVSVLFLLVMKYDQSFM